MEAQGSQQEFQKQIHDLITNLPNSPNLVGATIVLRKYNMICSLKNGELENLKLEK
jgi:hypothetical protein